SMFSRFLFLGCQPHRPVTAVLLDQVQQVVGSDHVEETRMAIGVWRKCRIGTFEILPKGAQGDLAFTGSACKQRYGIHHEPWSPFDDWLAGFRLSGFLLATRLSLGN